MPADTDQVVSAEATPGPFKIQGRVEHCVIENLPVIARDGELPECYVGGDVNFVLEAMNSFDTLKERVAELDALKTLNILMSEMRNSAEREVATLRTALEGLMLAYERRIRSDCTPEQLEQKPWRVAEYCIAEEALTNKEPLAKVEDGGNNGNHE